MKRTSLVSLLALSAVVACSKTDTTPVDSALSMGAAAVPFDSLSPAERNALVAAPAPVVQTPAAPARTTPRRTSSTRSSSGSSGSSSSGTRTSAPAPARTTIKKNTERDAAIGAAAGAVIGATTSRDKVKGAIIGGVVGGVIGGVIGNNVDVKKKKQ